MIETTLYAYIVLAIAGGLLTLLSSVGIFISLIVQRRLDRLQEILEEFINLSYRSEINLTGKMHSLIEKYQMNYIFPHKPRSLILSYIDFNIFFILFLWTITFFMYCKPPLQLFLLLQLIPLIIGIYASLFFRRLLRNTINLENPLLETIVPSPARLRSISYLSHFINLSVESVLKQARLSLNLSLRSKGGQTEASVFLKEELSYDDFFFYLVLQKERPEKVLFLACGEIRFHFPPDPITKKPVPVCRNINIPLGSFHLTGHTENISAKFLVFTRGEKHPVQYSYQLIQGRGFLASAGNPDIVVNHQIVYQVQEKKIRILENKSSIPCFQELSPHFNLQGERYYLDPSSPSPILRTCLDDFFID